MNKLNLQDVLEEYTIRAKGENNPKVLREMIEENPQFTAELEDFAAARAVLKYAPEPEFSSEEQTRHEQIGRRNLQAILGGTAATVSSAQSIPHSLTDAAKLKGMNKKAFAAALGLSVSLVQYLEKRRLVFSTVPKTIIAKIAETLGEAEESVSAYLNQPPDTLAQASFKTNTRPEEMPAKDFAEAVREDQILSAPEKQKLLDLIK